MTRRALLVGNESFDDKRVSPLKSPVADSEALATLLRAPDIGGFETDAVIDGDARAVKLALERTFMTARRDDLVLLYMSGHGAAGAGGLLYCPSDADADWLESTCVRGSFIRDLMNRSSSTSQIVVLDCCFSGSFARDLIVKDAAAQIALTEFEGTGRAVITSSTAIQPSFEMAGVEGGWTSAFTQALVRGISSGAADLDADGRITLRDLYDYAYDEVTRLSFAQTPSMTVVALEGDLVVARTPLAVSRVPVLPADLEHALRNAYPGVRLAAVDEVGRLLESSVAERAASARRLLKRLKDGDDRGVAERASEHLRNASAEQRRVARRRRRLKPAPGTRVSRDGWFRVESRKLKRALDQVLPAASSDATRTILQGVLMETAGANLRLVATDSYRLAIVDVDLPDRVAAARVLLPADELRRLPLRADSERVTVAKGETSVDFEINSSPFVIPVIEADFPEYRPLVPQYGGGASLIVNRLDFVVAVEEVSDLGAERVIELKVQHGAVNVAGGASARDAQSRLVSALTDGEPTTVGLNTGFLLQALQAVDSPTARIAIQDLKNAVAIRGEGNELTYLVMPARLR